MQELSPYFCNDFCGFDHKHEIFADIGRVHKHLSIKNEPEEKIEFACPSLKTPTIPNLDDC
jgi:hypothetical protein